MKEYHSATSRKNIVVIVSLALALAFAFLSAILAYRDGTFSLLLIKLGLKEDEPVNKDPYKAWTNCLEQLDLDADIVFIGDSITANGNFQSLIPDKKVCNLGCYGDQIWDVTARINAVRVVNPETVCIMIGINTLGCRSFEQATRSYSEMANAYVSAFPECKIVFIGLLPVAHKLESGSRTNTGIQRFNDFIRQTAEFHNVEFIDLFDLYVLNGELNPSCTEDGLHLTIDSYKPWVNAIIAE